MRLFTTSHTFARTPASRAGVERLETHRLRLQGGECPDKRTWRSSHPQILLLVHAWALAGRIGSSFVGIDVCVVARDLDPASLPRARSPDFVRENRSNSNKLRRQASRSFLRRVGPEPACANEARTNLSMQCMRSKPAVAHTIEFSGGR